jgi:23S rRNA pseudouridine1911/1915/1917 synthase
MHAAMQAGTPEERVAVALGPEHAGLRLDRALALALPQHSRERLKALISAGHVAGAAGLLRDPARKVVGSERLVVAIPKPVAAETPAQAIPLAIVHEDAHLLVVDKPAGLVVHPAAGNPDGTLVNALLHHCAGRLSGIGGVARPGIVHRIDKDTSGLLVVAKTDPAHVGLARQFAAHSVRRAYFAVVEGHPGEPHGRIETHLARSPANRKKVAVVEPPAGKRAVTHWEVTRLLQDAAAIACRLETGRTHQVRVHMATIGHSLVGDPVYGSRNARRIGADAGFRRQALHARTLGFQHPVTQEDLSFESPLPHDIQELVSLLSV